jgi:hypothetical protein
VSSIALFTVRVARNMGTIDGANGISEIWIVFGVLKDLKRGWVICIR